MDQLTDYSDDRLIGGCLYCGGPAESRDHVPPKVLLDPPFPTNLQFVDACRQCNSGFSIDEEYFACLIESVVAGSTAPDQMRRPGIARILRRSPALRARLEAARMVHAGRSSFVVEANRVRNVLTKFARGHAAYELSQTCIEEPSDIWCRPLALMDAPERDAFEACHILEMFGEVGSRGMQRLVALMFSVRTDDGSTHSRGLLVQDWIEVQPGRYRFMAIDDGRSVNVRMVIAGYLACEVTWGPSKKLGIAADSRKV